MGTFCFLERSPHGATIRKTKCTIKKWEEGVERKRGRKRLKEEVS
jgi:hypothetical protein